MFSRRLSRSLAAASVSPATKITIYSGRSITRNEKPRVRLHRNSLLPSCTTFSTSTPRQEKEGKRVFIDQAAEDGSEGKAKETKEKEGDEDEAKEKEIEKEIRDGVSKSPRTSKADSPSNKENAETSPAFPDENGSAADSGGVSGLGNDGSGDGGRRGRKPSGALAKPIVPDVYPQVMAIPIAKRPLFPGFYKAITIKDPNVVAAIKEMVKRGQQYVGAFLFKDENADEDVIRSPDDVYDVGVFAQITSAFPLENPSTAQQGLTAILYPHRRIKLSILIPPRGEDVPKAETGSDKGVPKPEPIPCKEIHEASQKGDVVASFEESAVEKKSSKSQYDPTSFLKRYPVSIVHVENLEEEPYDPKSPVIRAVTNEIVNVFKDVASMNNLFRDQISTFSTSSITGNVTAEPNKLADFAAAVSAGEPAELQEILESLNVEDRLHKAFIVLKKELMNAQLQSKITKDVENKITKRQREYWLMEQMKGIRRELGIESDGKDKLIEKFKEKAAKLAMPETVRRIFDEEINKLAHLEAAASEFNVTRNYLDWLTQIPWGMRSAENFNIPHATAVLDEDHYGLNDVKERILEFIAVGKLRGTVEGKILCFVGPPGVGKTSIGKSIARALHRQFYRFSVGGLTDVAEIKGHRRTYVGALPGRLIQSLKKCQTENPLILIDEIDKVGKGYQGDPASALLELLDPEQNNSFLDHYLDVPVDLSKVLFVCTANMTDTIPRPLLDRMEVIRLSGYVADEKMAIAQRFLAPAARDLAGLKDVDVQLDDAAVEELIKSYCRESGVRNLKKHIEKIYRKSAFKIVSDLEKGAVRECYALTEERTAALEESEKDERTREAGEMSNKEVVQQPHVALKVPDDVHMTIDKANLKDYVGAPIFTSDRLYDVTPPGVTMGLAWTQLGGSAMYIESLLQEVLRPSTRPSLEITGNLKTVMKESSAIAYSYAKSLMAKHFPDNHFFQNAKIHVHVPEGAVQKDGPSAGITMTTSLLSLALATPVEPTVAMTGELTLIGKVLRIGGLKEKTVAARRAGCKMVIFPEDNMSDWLELPDNIKEGIEGRPVSWFSDVFDILFPTLDRTKANERHICERKKETDVKSPPKDSGNSEDATDSE